MAKSKERLTSEAKLSKAIGLARRVLRKVSHERFCTESNLWVFLILERMVSASKSIQILLKKRQMGDCFLIGRTIYDHSVQIQYILHDPLKTDELLELFGLESAVDMYDIAKVIAEHEGISVADLAAKKPFVADCVRRYKKATRHEAFNASNESWPKRWKNIGVDEMLKACSGKNRSHLDRYVTSLLGNAFAHGRPIALEYSSRWARPGVVEEQSSAPVPFKAHHIRGECALFLLTSTYRIIVSYHLDELGGSALRLLASAFPKTFGEHINKS